jgi:DNA polymerase-3 subunit epsilon
LQLQLFGTEPAEAPPAAKRKRREVVDVPERVEAATAAREIAVAVEVLVIAEGSAPVETAPVEPTPAAATPRVLVFDVETTGTDKKRDQIIELCVQTGLDDGAPSRIWRFRPAVAITPGAQAVHGITIEDLAGCPSFAECAAEVAAVFAECDVVVGYNLAFDIDMIQAEYERCGLPLLDFAGKTIVDAFRLWQQCEPRSLQHAHLRFVGNAFEAAHTASADVAATGRVLAGMLRAFELDGQDWDQIATKCDPQLATRASWVGPSRHLRWENEVVVLGFGKHGGAAVHELAAGPDRGFLRWMLDRDFPPHVTEVCRAALDRPSGDFLAWARQRFGVAAPTSAPPFTK